MSSCGATEQTHLYQSRTHTHTKARGGQVGFPGQRECEKANPTVSTKEHIYIGLLQMDSLCRQSLNMTAFLLVPKKN